MTSPFQAGFCSCFCSGCCPPAEHKVPCIQGQLQLSVLQALLSLSCFWSREVAKVPLVGLACSWQEAWNLSAASLRCCPSPALVQDFRAFSPLSQPSSAPCVTLETALVARGRKVGRKGHGKGAGCLIWEL